MHSRSEIEAAIGHLPTTQQAGLLAFLTRRVKRPEAANLGINSPVALIVGASAGGHAATGRKAEELHYGKGA